MRYRHAGLVLVLFVAAVLAAQVLTPVMEGMDEPVHYNYVEYLRTYHQLPDRGTYLTNNTRQASGQPPLVYWLDGLPLRLLNVPVENGEALLDNLQQTVRNRWIVPNMDTDNRRDNLNLYYHGRDEEAFGHPAVVYKVHLMRLVSLLLAVTAVLGAFAAAREVFPHSPWAYVSTLLFAFTPTMIEASSTVTNDIGAICFGTLAIWQTLRLVRNGDEPITLVLMGLFAGLAGLSKINGLLIVPGMVVAVWFASRLRKHRLRQMVVDGLILAIPMVILLAPWVIWGGLQFHDPIGINTHKYNDSRYYFAALRPLSDVLALMPEFYLTYWGNISPQGTHSWLYAVITLIPLGALAGTFTFRKRKLSLRSLASQQVLVLMVMALAMLGAIVYWMQRQSDVWARLIYPAQAAFALLFTVGLAQLANRFPLLKRPLQYGCSVLMLTAALILSPLNLTVTFGLPMFLPPDRVLSLEGPQIDFDHTIRFLGYSQDSNRIAPDKHTLKLCWEVLQATTKPAVFSVKFVRNGDILADRTSIHGLGHFNSVSWRPGDRFCDRFDIFIDDPDVPDDPPPAAGQVYDMLVTVLNATTLEADWAATTPDGQPIPYPFVGQVVSPAGNMTSTVKDAWQSSDIRFPHFAHLQGFALDQAPVAGADIQIRLLWAVDQPTPDSWTAFIHLDGPEGHQSLMDGIPRNGNYPTWAWAAGEKIVDQWRLHLPEHLTPGDYALTIGFYEAGGQQRMPALQRDQAAADNSPTLLRFHIP